MSELVRYISEDGSFYMISCDTTEVVTKAQKIHQTSPVCSAALGRLLTGACLMGSMLKGENDSLTMRINGKGPAGSVISVADSKSHVKGYIQEPVVNLELNSRGKLDVAGAVGTDGDLTVIKDLGLKEPYIGRVPIISGEIAEDITEYYASSEQIPTVCALGVLVDTRDQSIINAGGFLIQLLPTATDDTIEKIEAAIDKSKPVTAMLSEGASADEIVSAVLTDFSMSFLDKSTPEYRCDCSRERTEKALLSLGKKQLTEISEDPITEVCCHFCNKKYKYTHEEIKSLADKAE